MSIQVTQRPHIYCFSKNPILYKFYVTDATEPGCVVELNLTLRPFESTDATLQKKYTTITKPLSNGICDIYIEDIVDSMIDINIPPQDGDVIQKSDNIYEFDITFRRITDADPLPAFDDSEKTHTRYVFKGGIENVKFDHNNYFINIQQTRKPFATWLQGGSFIGLKDDIFLSILFADITNTDARRLRVFAEWTDGTSDVSYFDIAPNVAKYGFYNIRAGAEALGINAAGAAYDPKKKLYRYHLQVVSPADDLVVFSEEYLFYIDYNFRYNAKLFNYYNSLGGIDFVRVLGDTEEDYTRNFAEAEMFSGSVIGMLAKPSQYIQTNNTRLNSYKSDVGLRFRPDQVLSLQDLLMSPLIWEDRGVQLSQVFLLNKNAPIKKESDKKWSFPVEWRYGFTEQVYTPFAIDLGAGEDREEYDGGGGLPSEAPTGLVATNLGGPTWAFEWVGHAGDVKWELQYRIVGTPVWTSYLFNFVEYLSGIIVAAGEYEWQVRGVNAIGDFTPYAIGSHFIVT